MKTIISKIINNKVLRFLFNPINISIIIAMFFLIIAVLFALSEGIISALKLLYDGFLPILILFLFKYISKVCKKTWVFIVLSFLSFIHVLIYLIFLLLLLLASNDPTQDYVYEYKSPPKEKYYEKISNITSRLYRIKHFPKEIPSNAENYFFKAEKSFDGFDIHYLKFNINDKNYFDQIIKNNKTKIYKKLGYNKVYKHYRDLEVSIKYIEENPNTTLYILKNQNNDLSYTSGFIISKTDNLIVFFYANYCLDTSKTVYGEPLNSSE